MTGREEETPDLVKQRCLEVELAAGSGSQFARHIHRELVAAHTRVWADPPIFTGLHTQ